MPGADGELGGFGGASTSVVEEQQQCVVALALGRRRSGTASRASISGLSR